jgi:hypothetical protein
MNCVNSTEEARLTILTPHEGGTIKYGSKLVLFTNIQDSIDVSFESGSQSWSKRGIYPLYAKFPVTMLGEVVFTARWREKSASVTFYVE